MKKLIISAELISVLLFSACFQKSLNPFYSEETLINIPELEGEWIDNDHYRINIQSIEGNQQYRMTVQEADGKSTAEFSVHAFTLFETTFLDVLAVELKPEISNAYFAYNLLPTHNVFKLQIIASGAEIRLTPLRTDWTNAVVSSHQISIPFHAIHENEVLLTASTLELQQLLAYSLQEADAYDDEDPITWKTARP